MSVWTESAPQAWVEKYGAQGPAEVEQIAGFLLHRSVRRYSDREVPEPLISALVGAAQSAATSSNLQMWSVISVQDPERRAEIARLCADQKHIVEAPWFFAFIADHFRIQKAAHEAGEGAEGLGYMEFLIMALIDTALAAERMVCAAESVGLGICYIGALRNHPEGVKKLLGMPSETFGAFGLTMGYPAEDAQEHVKPRLDQDSVWFKETYDLSVSTKEYDERMKSFYESESMGGHSVWSKRSGRRLGPQHLGGRAILKSWLADQGFGLE